jgi:AraC-like DNA-binding protein
LTYLDNFLTVVDMQLIRGSCLVGFSPLAISHGADPATLLTAANLDPDDVGRRDRFIPLRNAIAAVQGAAAELEVVDFGRQVATRQSIDILGPVGVAARTAATVAEAFTILDTYMCAYSPGIAARVRSGGGEDLGRFEFDFLLHPPPPQDQAIELALGVALRVLRLFLGAEYRPVSVHLPHSPLGTKVDYFAYFGCPPRFNEPIAGFTVRMSDLRRPLNYDPLAHQLAVEYLSSTSRRGSDLVDAARSIVRQLLPTSRLSADLLARQFGIHPKTMRRRLAAEGITYAELVDETRCDVAKRLLLETELSLSQLCRQLGYSEQSVLTRSCRRWFDMTPSAYREAWSGSQVPE